MNEYSPLKSLWWTDDIAGMREGRQAVPSQVHFILSDLCNQDCHFCAYRMSGGFTNEQFPDASGNKNPNRRIPTGKALEILEDLSHLGVRAIQFTGGGEPTAHPDHCMIFENALTWGMRTALVTNGLVMRPEAETVYPRMDWIRVSVDAGTAKTYAKVRRVSPSQYDTVMKHITEIARMCAPDKTTLGAGFVVTRENWRELPGAAKRLQEAGAHNMRVTAMFSTDGMGYYNGIEDDIEEEILAAHALTGDDFIINLWPQREKDLLQMQPDYTFCGYQQMCTYIGGDQKVYRCCSTAYTKHGEVGDLKDQRFRDWFK